MSEIDYPKLKHLLSEKWQDIYTLKADVVEDFLLPSPDKTIKSHAQGEFAYCKANNQHSFRKKARNVTEISAEEGSTRIAADMLTVFDGEYVYEEQGTEDQRFVYILRPRHRSVRMTIPCIHFFKFLERRGVVSECALQEINGASYYVLGMDILQEEKSEQGPAMEVFYLEEQTGLLACERFIGPHQREIGRRVYSNFRVNAEDEFRHFQYTKPPDVTAMPVEDSLDT